MKLIDYFKTSFINNRVTVEIKTFAEYGNLDGRMHYDFNAGCRFLSFYIPNYVDKNFFKHLLDGICGKHAHIGVKSSPFQMLKRLSLPSEEAMCGDAIHFGEYEVSMKNFSEQDVFFENMESLQFSGRVYFYIEHDLSDNDKLEILEYGKLTNCRIKFRTPKYAETANTFKQPKAFISHDSKDKDNIVRGIADFLNNQWCPVWYDEYSIKYGGNSLSKQIHDGLEKCPKCLIILSNNFIQNKSWANAEFESVVNTQISTNDKKIIPVYYEVDNKQVRQFNSYIAAFPAIIYDKENPDKSLRQIHNSIK